MYKFKTIKHSYDLIRRRFERTYMGEHHMTIEDIAKHLPKAVELLPDDLTTAIFKEYWFTDKQMKDIDKDRGLKQGMSSVHCRSTLYRLRASLIELTHGTRSTYRLNVWRPYTLEVLVHGGYDTVDKVATLTPDMLFHDYGISFVDVEHIDSALKRQFGLELSPNATVPTDPKFRKLFANDITA